MDKSLDILVLVALCVLFLCCIKCMCGSGVENFWNYNNKRTYFECKYGRWNPHRCSKLTHTFHDFKQNVHANPIGYVYLKTSEGKTYPLLGWYDGYSDTYRYYVKQYKSSHSSEYILIEIDTKNRQIYDGQEVELKRYFKKELSPRNIGLLSIGKKSESE